MTLPRRDCGAWEAEVDQVLGCLAFQTAVHHDAELLLDSLGYIEPMQLSVQQPRQVSVHLGTVTDFSSEDKPIAASYFARWFIGVLGRESPILGNFAPPEAKNRNMRVCNLRLYCAK